MRCKKGYTLVGVLIVVVIVGILATIAIPGFRQIIRRYELEEVRHMFEATRAGAKDYDFRIGIGNLPTAAPQCWEALNVNLPDNPICEYTIVAGGSTNRRLQVRSRPSGAWIWLYRYDLPNGPGAINGGNTDQKYIQDLPH